MENEATFQRIAEELQSVLEEGLPGIPWKQEMLGGAFPKDMAGYFFCDRIDYKRLTEAQRVTIATFTIELVCANPVKNGGNHRIENHAIEIRKALDAHRTLNGLARRSDVEQILFGSPQGSANIGVALITYTVEFYEPMEDFTIF